MVTTLFVAAFGGLHPQGSMRDPQQPTRDMQTMSELGKAARWLQRLLHSREPSSLAVKIACGLHVLRLFTTLGSAPAVKVGRGGLSRLRLRGRLGRQEGVRNAKPKRENVKART